MINDKMLLIPSRKTWKTHYFPLVNDLPSLHRTLAGLACETRLISTNN